MLAYVAANGPYGPMLMCVGPKLALASIKNERQLMLPQTHLSMAKRRQANGEPLSPSGWPLPPGTAGGYNFHLKYRTGGAPVCACQPGQLGTRWPSAARIIIIIMLTLTWISEAPRSEAPVLICLLENEKEARYKLDERFNERLVWLLHRRRPSPHLAGCLV